MTTVRIDAAGRASVQDLGRPGLGGTGIAVNGAADRYAARTANVLVGNPEVAPLLEVTASRLGFTTTEPALVSLTGAAESLAVDGHAQPAGQPVAVRAGGHVVVDAPRRGVRSYVAIHGLIPAGEVLGSVAPDVLLGAGHWLEAGDTITVVSSYGGLVHPHFQHPVFRLPAVPGSVGSATIDVVPGPEYDEFGTDSLAAGYRVSPRSDQVGLRLDGPTPPRSTEAEILSRGVPVGAVEVPPSGGLLVLLRGRLATAGYPVLAVATSTAIDALGQLAAGDEIGFRMRSIADAVADARAREAALERLRRHVHAAFAAAGLSPRWP